MRLVWDKPGDVAAWVAQRIDHMEGPFYAMTWAVGVEADDGRPLGGIVFTNHYAQYRSVEVSFAAESARWLTKPLITQIMRYPFGQLGVQRLTSITPKKAARARKFIDAFGFKREGVVRRGFGDDDAIISGLMAWEWRRSRFNIDFAQQKAERGLGGPTLAA